MKFQDLLDALDWPVILAAIETVPLKISDDSDAVVNMVLKATKRWGTKDVESMTNIETEFHFYMDVPSLVSKHVMTRAEAQILESNGVHGFIDLAATTPAGRTVIDWKTGGITPEKKQRLSLSWQGRIYAAAEQGVSYSYRMVDRDGGCSEVTMAWPNAAYSDRDVRDYLTGALAARAWQRAEGTPWHRNMPHACTSYGRECAHLSVCAIRNSAPHDVPRLGPLSATGIDNFYLCAERYRLDTLAKQAGGEVDDGGDRADLGRAFHAGMAEVYTQLSRLR